MSSESWAEEQFLLMLAVDPDLAARVAGGDPPVVVPDSMPVGEAMARLGQSGTVAVVGADEVELFRVERR